MLLEENRPLAPLTTLGSGGPARWYAQARIEDDVAEAASWARQRGVPLFVLGGGSNVVVADEGFDGLVLHIGVRGVQTFYEGKAKIFRVAAGEIWDQFVRQSVEEDCAGIECLAGIPGTVGGTPVQNVGAYGQEVAGSIERVGVFDRLVHAFTELSAAECGFGYRRSRFNSGDRGRFVVTRVDYRLWPEGAPTLVYPELERAFPDGSRPSVKEVASAVLRIRHSKGMLLVDGDPDCRSAGSFFKNPVVPCERIDQIATAIGQPPPYYPAGTGPESAGKAKLSAAWLIEHAGFSKGFARGAAGISARHSLALVNRGGARSAEILALADEIVSAVEARFRIRLELEPERLGFDVART
jgi:UDP-N-acetylmuramate dehydrogenase